MNLIENIFSFDKLENLLTNNETEKRSTFVDIFAENKEDKFIIDTKYKEFKKIGDFENADVYQVSTYCLLHNTKKAILLYPQWDEPQNYKYNLNSDFGIEINFKTINLRHNNLQKELDTIKEELKNMLKKDLNANI